MLVEARRAKTAAPEGIELDMEFADEGGEGATPYEVLLAAAMAGDSTRFTRQDGVEETWRIMQPLLDEPTAGPRLREGLLGPEAAEALAAGFGALARALGEGVTTSKAAKTAPAPAQSAAAPSPFPPIADYAFLSDCHTGALVAPDGAIDWLCVPAFDSPSVFGSLLDRQGGRFRFGPYGINHPTARIYEPGTNVLVTTWKTPAGWVVVRDALTMGPTDGEDEITPHTRPPADDDAEHMLVRTVECLEGQVEIELVCEPVFDYGRDAGGVDARRRRPPRRRRDAARARRSGSRPTSRSGIEGDRVRARHVLAAGRAALLRAVVGRGSGRAERRRRGRRRGWPRRRASGAPGWDARGSPTTASATPIQRSALAIKGLTYMPTGATVAALTTSLPETPGGERNWDYRYTWMRDTTFTLQALHYLNLDWEADEFMQFVADLEPNEDGALQIMYGIDGRRDLTESTRDDLSGYAGARPVRIGNGAFDQRQNDVFGAVLDSILLHTRRSQRLPRRLWPIVAGRRPSARRRSGASPTRASGRRAASRSTTCRRSSCAGSRWTAPPSWRRSAATPSSQAELAARPPRRSGPTSSSTA